MSPNTYIAIMAGGVGSRFWPASREARPKQFLDILGTGKSLLRLTFERFLHLCPPERIYIVTHADYRELVLQHLPELSPDQVIAEPARRNTAPCIAYTALKIHAINPEANMVVAPSDHIILQETAFVETLRAGLDFSARNDALLTLGIRPSRPDTGYGYIEYSSGATEDSVHKVLRFTEKPPLEKAREFIANGNYLWNAGIFIWRAAAVLDAFRAASPGILAPLEAGCALLNSAEEQDFILQTYPHLESISIDYAIMEKAANVFTIPSDFGWSDLGTWGSLHAESGHDEQHNVVQGSEVLLSECSDCLVRVPEGKLAVLRGLDGYIVVDEGDVLMIYPKSKEQEIKNVTKSVKENTGERYL